jgi:hypothetical protein
MSTIRSSETAQASAPRVTRIWTASYALVLMLIIQYALGIAYNLYGTAPTATKKVGAFSSPLLAIHVIMGLLLIITSIYLVVISIKSRNNLAVLTSFLGMLSLIAAGVSGSSFSENGKVGWSMAMGMTTAVALLCYVLNMRVLRANGYK